MLIETTHMDGTTTCGDVYGMPQNAYNSMQSSSFFPLLFYEAVD